MTNNAASPRRAYGVLFIFVLSVLASCTNLQRFAHMYSSDALDASTFRYHDGGSSLYYSFIVGDEKEPVTYVFVYGGSGCSSWKAAMPGYVDGLNVPARVFVLNKRHVSDRSTGMFGCRREFHLANNPEQWVADYQEFITTVLDSAQKKPQNVVLVGVSEGSLPAVRVAGRIARVTHLAIIGDGGFTMRTALVTLDRKGSISLDVGKGWAKISTDPRSIDKLWYGAPYRWWSDIMDEDLLPDFLRLDIPILVGIGEKDTNVPVESAQYLAEEFRKAGKNNLVLKIYPGADHHLEAGGRSYRREFFRELGTMLDSGHSAIP
jgi:pimeloyl-ACP methyl ester carboxylesterase